MKPVLLCILDGVGIRESDHGNAFKLASTLYFDRLWNQYPHSLLEASGVKVGLPTGQMGNSEVGHMNIGAGRIVYQPLQKINQAIVDGSFFHNEEILATINHVKQNHSKLHILGLISDGGIHSRTNHLFALLEMCQKEGIDQVYFHLFTDGRDTLPRSAYEYIQLLENKMAELNLGVIATMGGRYYSMDRDNRWDRVEKAYRAIVEGDAPCFTSPKEAIEYNYQQNIDDEFLLPCVLSSDGKVEANDGLLVFNYRPDRLRELFSALTNPNFEGFERPFIPNLRLTTMMPVSEEVINHPAFHEETLNHTLGEYLSDLGYSQLRIAETEKYAHVTYFFDGGIERELKKCKRILIPSPKVTTYDLSPAMSAQEITTTLLSELDQDYDLIILNYANGDMVGHTGNLEAAIQSVEIMDQCLGKLYEKIQSIGGLLIVTADHGNCEYMLDDQNQVITSHSVNKVPFLVCQDQLTLKEGKLADIAPTVLSLMKVAIPPEMTGEVLIQNQL